MGDLFVSGFEVADDRPLGDRDLLLQVADLRARLLDRATFIAIRYGFAARSAEDVVAKCAGLAPRWRGLLIAHREEVEMTLKAAAAAPPSRPDRRDFASGAAYMRALQFSQHARSKAAIDQTVHEFAEVWWQPHVLWEGNAPQPTEFSEEV